MVNLFELIRLSFLPLFLPSSIWPLLPYGQGGFLLELIMFAVLRHVRLLCTGTEHGFLAAAVPVRTSWPWFGSRFPSWTVGHWSKTLLSRQCAPAPEPPALPAFLCKEKELQAHVWLCTFPSQEVGTWGWVVCRAGLFPTAGLVLISGPPISLSFVKTNKQKTIMLLPRRIMLSSQRVLWYWWMAPARDFMLPWCDAGSWGSRRNTTCPETCNMFIRVCSARDTELACLFLCRKLIAYSFHAHLNPEIDVDFWTWFLCWGDYSAATIALPVKWISWFFSCLSLEKPRSCLCFVIEATSLFSLGLCISLTVRFRPYLFYWNCM